MGGNDGAALLLIMFFYGIMLIPCIGIGWIGHNLITRLGRHPSKTPAINMSIMTKLVMIEIVSLTLMLMFFKIMVSE